MHPVCTHCWKVFLVSFLRHLASSEVALYCAIRLRFGCRFESCDANGPRNVKNAKPCETKGRLIFPPLLPAGGQESQRESAWTRAISRYDSCDNETSRFVCPGSTRETDGIAAQLLRCGIASEALRRNMPLSQWKKGSFVRRCPSAVSCTVPSCESAELTRHQLQRSS